MGEIKDFQEKINSIEQDKHEYRFRIKELDNHIKNTEEQLKAI